jgi:glycosyltransferase EpsD
MKKRKNVLSVYKIDGVGVDLSKFQPASCAEKSSLRKLKGLSDGDFVINCTAEFIRRKNHKIVFEILPALREKIPCLKIVLCGKGELLEFYKNFAEEKKLGFVKFAGYVNDTEIWYKASDLVFSPSFQEGLPVNIIEAMACGLPVVASKIRGITDIVEDCSNGFLFAPQDAEGFFKAIILLYKNPSLRAEMGARNVVQAEKFSVEKALHEMTEIYEKCIDVIGGGGSYNYRIIVLSREVFCSSGKKLKFGCERFAEVAA